MESQLQAFLEAVKHDSALQEKFKVSAGDADSIVAIAKAAGFCISVEELINAAKADDVNQLSDGELEAISGGGTPGAFAWFAVKVGVNIATGYATITFQCIRKSDPNDTSWIDGRINGPD